MSNRHQRRAEVRAFRRDVHHDHIVTYLVDASARIDHHPLLSRASSYWRGNIEHLRPFCPACRTNFADGALPGAFLFSTPPTRPTSASVTAFCTECWNDLPISAIERISARVLQAVVPGGEFEPMGVRR